MTNDPLSGATGETTLRVGGPEVAWTETGDEIVILDINGSVYFGLNSTASVLWKALVSGATTSGLVAALAASAPVNQEQAASDVEAFLSELERYGLLRL